MTTTKKRIKVALTEEAIENLCWLTERENKTAKKWIYPCEVIERLLANEVTIVKAFGNEGGDRHYG